MDSTTLVIQSILIFVIGLLGVLLFALPKGRKHQNIPLCLFLLLIALHVFIDLRFDTPIFGSEEIHLFPSVGLFLYAPLVFLHSRRVLRSPKTVQWIHFIPFVGFTLYYLFIGFSDALFFISFGCQYALYLFLIARIVREAKAEKKIAKIWAVFVSYCFGLIWFMAFTAKGVSAGGYPAIADQIEAISYVVAILFFVGLIYFALSQPALFMDIKISVSNQLRASHDLSESDQQRKAEIKQLFEEKKIFTNPDLNRELIAQKLGTDVQQLSKDVNQFFKMNLSELIIQYRLDEAQDLLKSWDASIKEIYFEVGFSSRSVFNTSFKKKTGMTPSEYKKAHYSVLNSKSEQ